MFLYAYQKINLQNDQIRYLENACKDYEKTTNEKLSQIKKTGEIQKGNGVNDSLTRVAMLGRELEEFKTLHVSYVEEHRNQELNLRKERWKHDGHNEAFLRKYDHTCTIKQNKYDEIKKAYVEELAVLNELEEKFKPLETEYNEVNFLIF